MTDRDGFLQAVHAQPNDPLPRLVYADWLDETGHATEGALQRVLAEPEKDAHRLAYADAMQGADRERAEFVRVQVELARLEFERSELRAEQRDNFGPSRPSVLERLAELRTRIDTLRRRERELWESKSFNLWSFVPWVPKDWTMTGHVREIAFRVGIGEGVQDIWCYVRRGFVEVLSVPAADFFRYAEAITDATPLAEVRLTTEPGWRSRGDGGARLTGRQAFHPVSELVIRSGVTEFRGSLLAAEWSRIKFTLPDPHAGLFQETAPAGTGINFWLRGADDTTSLAGAVGGVAERPDRE